MRIAGYRETKSDGGSVGNFARAEVVRSKQIPSPETDGVSHAGGGDRRSGASGRTSDGV